MDNSKTLDSLKPKHLAENEDGPLTQIPNSDRLEPSASDEASKAKDAIRETGSKLKDSAGQIVGSAKESVRNRADAYTFEAADKCRVYQDTAREAAVKLKEGQPGYVADGVDLISSKIGDAADYFEKHSADEIANDVRDTVKKHPMLVFGGLIAAGFALGRFVKASDADELS